MPTYITGNDLGGTQQSLSSSYKSIVSILAGSTPKRSCISEITGGADNTPVDIAITWDLSRQSADDGTKTNVTPNPLIAGDTASLGLSRANFTAEGTVTAASSLFCMPINTRAGLRWVAIPGQELWTPATSNNGLILRAKSASYASTVVGKLTYTE